MHYAGARFYMSAIGRWGVTDPLADDFPAWSPYNYVQNNPIGAFDPDGLAPVECPPHCGTNAQVRGGWSQNPSAVTDHYSTQAQNQRLDGPTASDRTAGEIAVGFVPGLGEAADAYELITGQTWTGQEGSRGAAALGLAIPIAGSGALKGSKNIIGDIVGGLLRRNTEIVNSASSLDELRGYATSVSVLQEGAHEQITLDAGSARGIARSLFGSLERSADGKAWSPSGSLPEDVSSVSVYDGSNTTGGPSLKIQYEDRQVVVRTPEL